MPTPVHAWNVSPDRARAIQTRLRSRLIGQPPRSPIRSVAGIDIGFEQSGTVTRAAVVVFSFPALEQIDEAIARRKTRFPYVPGLLSFRECPAALAALGQLPEAPDALLCDGQGYAHPRRFGLACHLGLLTELPSVGVAKSRLIGVHAPLAEERGARVALMDGGEIIGTVLRTRAGVKPLYVSVGHRMTLDLAVELVLACTPRYRLPETTRAAHRLASG